MKNEELRESIKEVVETMSKTLNNINLISDIEVSERDKNPFLENEQAVLRALMYQSVYCQTTDKITLYAVNELKNIKENKYKDLAVEYTLRNLNKLYLLSEDFPYSWENEYIVENLVNGNMEHFFDKYFEKTEGHSCSHDKTSHVISMIKQSIKSGKDLELYSEYDFGKGLVEAYWTPKTLKTTKQAIDKFNDWYHLK